MLQNGETMRRNQRLMIHIEEGYLRIRGNKVYHEEYNSKGKVELRYTTCGLWYKGYRNCRRPYACTFYCYKGQEKGDIDCYGRNCWYIHSNRRVKVNTLNPKMVQKLITNVSLTKSQW
jgi:hypothetical protein